MATITAKDVSALRQATGLGMMECKKALEEAGGDFDKAADLVRQKYGAKMAGRSDRASNEGRIAVAASADGAKAALIVVHTETDFTAGNDAFKALVQQVADLALAQPAGEVSKSDAMEAAIEKVRITTQENIQFGGGSVLGAPGSKVGSYVHFTGKIGVLVEVAPGDAACDDLLKDLCMHVSAISPSPLGVTEAEVPADVVEKERKFARQEALASGKPAQIAEKMVEGKIRKYLDSVVLLRQPFVKDDKKQIKDILPKGVEIRKFVRLRVGT
ncbi:MAG: translation elongation factor Ts [Phycisphaeraceae bacterium]|nr:translation elongation factor Ts [Phycisphaeraceae bacterium]